MRGLDSGPLRWKRVSGQWSVENLEGPVRSSRSRGPAESMLLLAGRNPEGGIAATFRILEPSDETAGGAIVYLEFVSPRDFMAFHFCPGKSLVECFSRTGNSWRRMGLPVHYDLTIGSPHGLEIRREDGIYRLRLDDKDVLALRGKGNQGRFGLGSKICPVEFTDLSILPAEGEQSSRAHTTLSYVTS